MNLWEVYVEYVLQVYPFKLPGENAKSISEKGALVKCSDRKEKMRFLIFPIIAAKFEFENFSELKRCNSNLDGGPTVPDKTMKLMLDEMLDNSEF